MSDPTYLLPRVAAGEQAAVALCVQRYGPLVWTLARRYCRDRHEAEDAVQEVFIALWKAADRFDPDVAAEKTFVAMIARRRLIDALRRSGRNRPTVELDEGDDTLAESAPSDRVDAADEAARARKAMADLPDEQREAIKLTIDAGLTHSQIAERLDLPLGTVKTRIRRGLIAIREKLAAQRLRPSEVAS